MCGTAEVRKKALLIEEVKATNRLKYRGSISLDRCQLLLA
jgi:hypothetical protein